MSIEKNKHGSQEYHKLKHEAHTSPLEQVEREKQPEDNHETKDRHEHARELVEKHAESKDKIKTDHEAKEGSDHVHHYVTKKIKTNVFHQTLDSIRPRLSNTDQKFSNLIHNDIVEKASDIGDKTIARPNAILGGGIFIVIGSLIILVVARKFGFEVPLSVFISLYVIGFGIFFLLDVVLVKVLSRKKR